MALPEIKNQLASDGEVWAGLERCGYSPAEWRLSPTLPPEIMSGQEMFLAVERVEGKPNVFYDQQCADYKIEPRTFHTAVSFTFWPNLESQTGSRLASTKGSRGALIIGSAYSDNQIWKRKIEYAIAGGSTQPAAFARVVYFNVANGLFQWMPGHTEVVPAELILLPDLESRCLCLVPTMTLLPENVDRFLRAKESFHLFQKTSSQPWQT